MPLVELHAHPQYVGVVVGAGGVTGLGVEAVTLVRRVEESTSAVDEVDRIG